MASQKTKKSESSYHIVIKTANAAGWTMKMNEIKTDCSVSRRCISVFVLIILSYIHICGQNVFLFYYLIHKHVRLYYKRNFGTKKTTGFMKMDISVLQSVRQAYRPTLPAALQGGASVKVSKGANLAAFADTEKISALFPSTSNMPDLKFSAGEANKSVSPINVAVILSGGQAPGGHNVIAGLFDGIKSLNADSKLFGFKGGPSGLIDNDYIEISSEYMDAYRNTGGFDMIGSGRTKLEEIEQFDKV